MSAKRALPDTPVGEHHGGNFHVYMRHKIARLHAQYNYEDAGAQVSEIFKGLVFFINGHIGMPVEEMQNLIRRHGGEVDAYQLAGKRVTHILALHLPHTKIRQRQAQKLARGAAQQTPVVHPSFVLDSIEQGRLLLHARYLVSGLKDRHGSSIQGFLGGSKASGSGISPVEDGDESDGDSGGSAVEDGLRGLKDLRSAHIDGGVPPAEANAASSDDFASTSLCAPPPTDFSSTSLAAVTSSPKLGSGSGGRRSDSGDRGVPMSKDDPNFISKFFQQSRLHFIGSFKGYMQDLLSEMYRERKRREGPATLVCKRSGDQGQRVVLHMDMDCYFVSVVTRDRPELQGKPVAVAHTGNAGGAASSEISSCNYEARKFGVHAGMWMGQAKGLCPHLTVLRYDFAAYEEVSKTIYDMFFTEAEIVQVVSCDEAYLELAPGSDGEAVAKRIRERIMERTRCPASAGVSCNMLLARLATKRAKPNGLFVLREEDAPAYLETMDVKDLPGVGGVLGKDLHARGIKTCGQLQEYTLGRLQTWFGEKRGKMLYDSCRGIDRRELVPDAKRKSLGADVNWGVRFTEDQQARDFIKELSEEVGRRCERSRVRGRTITFHLKRSQIGDAEPEKLGGCGPCDDFSRSETMTKAVAAPEEICRVVLRLYDEVLRAEAVMVTHVRGVGIHLSKLEEMDGEHDKQSALMKAWLKAAPAAHEAAAAALVPQNLAKERLGAMAEELSGDDGDDILCLEDDGGKETDDTSRLARKDLPARQPASPSSSTRADITAPSSCPPRLSQYDRLQEEVDGLSGRAAHRDASEGRSIKPRPITDQFDMTLSQLDTSFLQALPEDLRREVQASAAEAHRVRSNTSTATVVNDPLLLWDEDNSRSPVLMVKGGRAGAKGRQRQIRLDELQQVRKLKQEGGLDPRTLEALPLPLKLYLAQQGIQCQQHVPAATMPFLPAPQSSSPPLQQQSPPPQPAKAQSKRRAMSADRPRAAHGGPSSGPSVREAAPVKLVEGVILAREDRNTRVVSCLFDTDEEVGDVRAALLGWLEGITEPATAHLELLCTYFLELVETGRSDLVAALMRPFRRFVERSSETWRQAYSAILEIVQEELSKREKAWASLYLPNVQWHDVKLLGLQL